MIRTRKILRRLIGAMDALMRDSEVSEIILITQCYYLHGSERTREATGQTKTAFYDAVKQGEWLIRREYNNSR